MGCLQAELLLGLQLFVLERQDAPARPQPGTQFVSVEGLGEIVVRTGLQSPNQILFVILVGYQQDVLVRGPGPSPTQGKRSMPFKFGMIQSRISRWGALICCKICHAFAPSS